MPIFYQGILLSNFRPDHPANCSGGETVPQRTICVLTGSRAEYGLLYWLMREIDQDPDLALQIVATGAHLSPEFSLSYRAIEADGFAIDEKVEILLSSDTATGMAKSLGLGMIGLADAFRRLNPDLLVLLGDRYEILAAAQTALFARIPVAHISGGESTEGAIDEAIRHAITKLSHWHFVAAETYRRRVIQLGEDPCRVFNYGDPGLDNIRRLPLLDQQELEQRIAFRLGGQSFLITYHPVTNDPDSAIAGCAELLAALDCYPQARLIITGANADAGGRAICSLLTAYAGLNEDRAMFSPSLGQVCYLSAMKHCRLVIGNSSSGIIEAPAMKTATVNIGDRQQGRLKAASIIDCGASRNEIAAAIGRALSRRNSKPAWPTWNRCTEMVLHPGGSRMS
jgi:UDP-N-acetylglucosamine 2-epimerase (non-hydrolysing)/GDP/UDP-N,N'-diacetylbacillosamine 2-epimerase (hydrolysing)